jgi:hypothetical protein
MEEQAWRLAGNQRGPWWNAGASDGAGGKRLLPDSSFPGSGRVPGRPGMKA